MKTALILVGVIKSFVALLAMVAVVAADVSHIVRKHDQAAVILKQEADVNPTTTTTDSNQSIYETVIGIAPQEPGQFENVGTVVLKVDDDDNRYQPQSTVHPTPPAPAPIPDILKALEYFVTQLRKSKPGQRA